MNREEYKLHSCCFFGHRKITVTDELISILRNIIKNLIISKKVDTFVFGSNSEFDDLCYKVVTELKEKYCHIKRIYVRAEFPYIDDDYKNYILQSYEDPYYPSCIVNAGKSVYIKRNSEMIDISSFCVVYYDENYPLAKAKKPQSGLTNKCKSGTKLAYDYAKRKGLWLKNVFDVNHTVKS